MAKTEETGRSSRVYIKTALILLLWILFSLSPLFGEQEEERYNFYIVTRGPTSTLYLSWGHIGMILEDTYSGTAFFYDYGHFSFDTEDFYTNFAMGRLYFTKEAEPVAVDMLYSDWYREWSQIVGRTVKIHKLNIEQSVMEELQQYLNEEVKPENKVYLYHHFYDNCATRVRDVIDIATEGALRELTESAPTKWTFRKSFRSYVTKRPFSDWFLSTLQGKSIDSPITLWEEMFLPYSIEKILLNLSYVNSRGIEVPFVSESKVIYENLKYPGPAERLTPLWLYSAIVGIIGGLLLLLLRKNMRDSRKVEVTTGVLYLFFGLLLGFVGLLLFFLMFFTDHDVTYNNTSILVVNPLLLMLFVAGIRRLKGLPEKPPVIPLIFLALSLVLGITLLLPSPQKSIENFFLFLPLSIAASLPVNNIPKWFHLCRKSGKT